MNVVIVPLGAEAGHRRIACPPGAVLFDVGDAVSEASLTAAADVAIDWLVGSVASVRVTVTT